MSYQDWHSLPASDGASSVLVKVDIEVLDELFDRHLGLRMKDGYPWVTSWPSACSACAPTRCKCSHKERFEERLHVFVWRFFKGPIPKTENGASLDIHHVREDKLDARIRRLGIGTRAQHAKVHSLRRRKFGRKKKFETGGLRYRPRMPETVKTPENTPELKALIGTKANWVKSISAGLSLSQQVSRLERLLENILHDVLVKTAALEKNGTRIPRSSPSREWRSDKTRKLGLKMPRLDCKVAEVVFVRAYVYCDFEIEKMAEAIAEPEKQAETATLLRTFLKRPSVSEWINRWIRYRRLPLP